MCGLAYILAHPDQGLSNVQSTSSSSWATNGNLTGKYVNTLGSVMMLTCTETDGSAVLSGYYVSEVGNAYGTYDLSGRATSCGNDGQGGFVVAWANQEHGNSMSCTSWTFQAQQYSSPIVLTAPWIMVYETTQENSWAANIFGLDMFTKQSDSDGSITERTSTSTISE